MEDDPENELDPNSTGAHCPQELLQGPRLCLW